MANTFFFDKIKWLPTATPSFCQVFSFQKQQFYDDICKKKRGKN